MRIIKVLNNSTVLATSDNGEMVLLGNGIGFNKKVGDTVSVEKIEKKYLIEKKKDEVMRLVNSIGETSFNLAKDIVDIAESELGEELNKSSYLLLADHIEFAIKRMQNNIFLPNMLKNEVKMLYPKEHRIGLQAIDYIYHQTGIEFPVDEAAFMAMHIFNSKICDQQSEIAKFPEVIENIVAIIEDFYNFKLDSNSLEYNRLVTHLKYLQMRLSKEDLASYVDHELPSMVKKDFKKAYQVVPEIGKYLTKEYETTLSSEEEMYLTLHINRIISDDD